MEQRAATRHGWESVLMSGERVSWVRMREGEFGLNAVLRLTLGDDGEFPFFPLSPPAFSFFLFLMGTFARVYMWGTRPIKLLILTFHFKFHPPFCINYLPAH
jgi:hypothetical protein